MLLLLLACTTAEGPACTDVPIHSCPTLEVMHECTLMYAPGGLTVAFEGFSAESYDATVSFDGEDLSLRCEAGQVDADAGVQASCSAEGLWIVGWGDVVEIEVDDGTTVHSDRFEPCWNADEPNGRCCGWSFSAGVSLGA
jgi:hypothetical protein